MSIPSVDDLKTNAHAQYEEALVSFVDILGFKNLIKDAKVEDILNVLRGKDTLSLARLEPSKNKTTTFTFSDLIVNVTPLDPERRLYIIFEQMRVLGFRQFLLATKGIFVRGGITIGDIYAKDRTIFGPALVRAYELENVAAKWPILAIDPDLVRAIEDESVHYLRTRKEKEGERGQILGAYFLGTLLSIIGKTQEGTYYLDYIECMAYEDTTTGDLRYYLSDHKETVTQAYRTYRHWKYEFIAKYHDEKCRHYFPKQSDLQIGSLPVILDRQDQSESVRRAEPDGAASGSQPIRSETNRTSSAAGSRR